MANSKCFDIVTGSRQKIFAKKEGTKNNSRPSDNIFYRVRWRWRGCGGVGTTISTRVFTDVLQTDNNLAYFMCIIISILAEHEGNNNDIMFC